MQELIFKKFEKKIEEMVLTDFEIYKLHKKLEGIKEECSTVMNIIKDNDGHDEKEMTKFMSDVTNNVLEKHKEEFEKHGLSVRCEVKVEQR